MELLGDSADNNRLCGAKSTRPAGTSLFGQPCEVRSVYIVTLSCCMAQDEDFQVTKFINALISQSWLPMTKLMACRGIVMLATGEACSVNAASFGHIHP